MRTISIHACKARWVPITTREGLARPSSAWFRIDPDRWSEEAAATLASATYLSLASVAPSLTDRAETYAFRDAFFANPDTLPCVLVVPDKYPDSIGARTYRWLGPMRQPYTAPYTKVARAGRTLRPSVEDQEWLTVTIEEVEVIETCLPSEHTSEWWSLQRLIACGDPSSSESVAIDEPARERCPNSRTIVHSRLAAFCDLVGRSLIHKMDTLLNRSAEEAQVD